MKFWNTFLLEIVLHLIINAIPYERYITDWMGSDLNSMDELIILLVCLYHYNYIIKVSLASSVIHKTTFQIKWAWLMGVPIKWHDWWHVKKTCIYDSLHRELTFDTQQGDFGMMMTRCGATSNMDMVAGRGQYETLDAIWIRFYDSWHRELSFGTAHD